MNEELEMSNEVPVESVLQLLLMFSSKAHMNIVKPLMMVILLVYQRTVSDEALYHSDTTQKWYLYLLFLLAMIPVQILLDSLSLYFVDVLYNYNILDYLRFCIYRYTNRKDDWMMNSAVLDISLGTIYRSLDVHCFSNQFYFCVGINAWGGILLMVGFQVMTLNSYNLFEDPFSLAFIIGLMVVGKIGHFASTLIRKALEIWVKSKVKDQKQFTPKMNLENYMMKEWNIYEHDAVRHSVLANKKEWIIDNMEKFVTKEHFKEDNGYLIRVHKKLEEIIKKEEIEEAKYNLITKNAYVDCAYKRRENRSKRSSR